MRTSLIRPYDAERDASAVVRVWREAGWLPDGKDAALVRRFMTAGRVFVAELDGEAEAFAAAAPGDLQYLDERLRLSAVTAVVTGRPARRQGLAGRATARLVAAETAAGAHVSALGMFEHGFYNRLGFGSGGYEFLTSFDPAHLRVDGRARPPKRLTPDDWAAIHDALCNRRRRHGSCNLDAPDHTRGELGLTPGGFGLGYADGPDGALTHFVWGMAEGENGPYTIKMLAYRTDAQLRELLALLHGLGDQVHLIRMREPRPFRLQDRLAHPVRDMLTSRTSEFRRGTEALAYWQIRICDLEACLARTRLARPEVRFNLDLTDPIARFLPPDAPWRGIGGRYTVTLGPSSRAAPGVEDGLPTLRASVGAFSRLWLGAVPASGLTLDGGFDAPPALVVALDETLCLPRPSPDWDF